MAFYNKVVPMLRKSITASNSLNGHSSMFNAMRCMSTKLFVGGLSFGTDDSSLKRAFDSFGDIDSAKVITDRDTGRSRGFGFVEFSSDECANSAMSAMDGQELNGRNIRVSLANERPPRSSYGGGFGDRGGYSNNRGSNDGF